VRGWHAPEPTLTPDTFASAYAQGFLRCAVASHSVTSSADPVGQWAATLSLLAQAHDAHAGLLVLPELGLLGYAIGDLVVSADLSGCRWTWLEPL